MVGERGFVTNQETVFRIDGRGEERVHLFRRYEIAPTCGRHVPHPVGQERAQGNPRRDSGGDELSHDRERAAPSGTSNLVCPPHERRHVLAHAAYVLTNRTSRACRKRSLALLGGIQVFGVAWHPLVFRRRVWQSFRR